MTTTYSNSLKLTLLGTGDGTGTWGNTTNTNLGTLLEQAITGVQSIVMSDANYTLTDYNGASDEARNAVLVCTSSTSLTATRSVIAPLVNKTYIIYNNTTGGQSITIIGASGSGVTISNGLTVFVYCDGVNFYSALNGTGNNFSVGNNLTVGGNSTTAGNSTTTGNASVGGTLGVTGNSTLSGNTSVGGTLGVTGAATFASNSSFTSTGAVKIPVGTTAQQPTPSTGMIRFNSDVPQFEGYNGTSWGQIGGGASAGGAIYENKQSISTNYTMSTNYNGESVGPITIAAGVSVTIPVGSRWIVF
jgi:hypothetical protein